MICYSLKRLCWLLTSSLSILHLNCSTPSSGPGQLTLFTKLACRLPVTFYHGEAIVRDEKRRAEGISLLFSFLSVAPATEYSFISLPTLAVPLLPWQLSISCTASHSEVRLPATWGGHL